MVIAVEERKKEMEDIQQLVMMIRTRVSFL